MIRHIPPKVVLVGGHTGPCGWELHDRAGTRRATTFGDLATLELRLQAADDPVAADALGRQRMALARIAEA